MKVNFTDPPNSLLAPSNFGYQHYVPIVKTKLGELWALENMKPSQMSSLTPLFEVHREKNASVSGHIIKVLKAVKNACGTRPLFLDSRLFGVSGEKSITCCDEVMSTATKVGLNFTPVTSLDRSNVFQQAIFTHSANGVMIRLTPEDFADIQILRSQLDHIVAILGVKQARIDLLIDYGAVNGSGTLVQLLRGNVNMLPDLNEWRSLTVAGGSFPSSLAAHTPHTWHKLVRHEWAAWLKALAGLPKLARLPSFGDYGVRDTQPPADFGSPSANLRYTSAGTFMLRRHDVLVKNGGSPGIHAICASLRSRTEFRGEAFTAGDLQIYIKSDPTEGPGNAGNWTAWGMSHHFGAVVDEIQNLPSF